MFLSFLKSVLIISFIGEILEFIIPSNKMNDIIKFAISLISIYVLLKCLNF